MMTTRNELTRTLPWCAVTVGGVRARDLAVIREARTAGKSGRGREIRERANLTQEEVAAAITSPGAAVSRAAIGMWESGRRIPSGRRALAYGRLLRDLESATV